MSDQAYSDGRNTPPQGVGVAVGTGITPKTYRRPPSQAEQARRQEWGRKWGKLVSEATREIREGT